MRGKKATKNIFSSLLLQVVTIICGFIVPKLIIGQYGSNVNGLIVSITQFLAYITLLEAGFGPVVKAILYKPIANKNKKEIENILKASEKFFKKISLIFIIYIIILILIYPIIVNSPFNRFFTMLLIIVISISTFAEYFFGMTYMLFLQAEQEIYIISYIQIITKIVNTIMIMILIYFKCDILIVKLVSSMIFVLKPFIQNIYVKKKFNINLNDSDSNFEIKRKWDGLAQHIAYVIQTNTDTTVLAIFSTVSEVSVYSVYMLIINGIRNLITAFSSGIEATFGDMIAKGEKETLKENFKSYEFLYYMIITIICICTIILVIPFVKVYTKGISDVNYVREKFAIIIILSEFVYSIRKPYNSLVLAAGHFRETQIGAWIESISNIIISCMLVSKYGMVGVAIGTLVSISIRTIEIIYYASKRILERPVKEVCKKVIPLVCASVPVLFICQNLVKMNIDSFAGVIIYSIVVLIIATLIISVSNFLWNKEEAKKVFNKLKNIALGGL